MTTVRRVTVGAACASLSVAWAYAVPASAATIKDFPLGGSNLSLETDASKAPSLSPGMYSTTLPAESKTWYVKVSRRANERLQVGFTGSLRWKDGAWLSPSGSSENFTTSISTSDGTQCQSQSVAVPGRSPAGAMPSPYLYIDPTSTARNKGQTQDNQACHTATSFTVAIQRSVAGSASEPIPSQLSVIAVPAVKSPPQQPSSDSLAPMDTSALPAKEKVTPGRGLFDAPALTPQGYTLDAVPGQVSFVKVHLSAGQRLSAGWEVPANGSSASVAQDLKVSGFILTPGLANAMSFTSGDSATVTPSSMGTQDIGMYTAPVNYANADLTPDKDHMNEIFVTDPGWYYVALRLAPTDASGQKDGLKSMTPVPTTLSLRVTGQASEGAAMDVAEPKPGTISGAPTASRVSTPVWAGLAVVGVIAVGALGFFMRRRAVR